MQFLASGPAARTRRHPGDKLFFLQPAMRRTCRWTYCSGAAPPAFPGQGALDLSGSLAPVLAAGPLSLEVFNDVFHQADPDRTAVDAHRPLLALAEATAAPTRSPSPRRKSTDRTSSNCPRTIPWPRSCQRSASRAPESTAPNSRNSGKKAPHGSSSTAPAAVATLAVESADPATAACRAVRLDATRLPRGRGLRTRKFPSSLNTGNHNDRSHRTASVRR